MNDHDEQPTEGRVPDQQDQTVPAAVEQSTPAVPPQESPSASEYQEPQGQQSQDRPTESLAMQQPTLVAPWSRDTLAVPSHYRADPYPQDSRQAQTPAGNGSHGLTPAATPATPLASPDAAGYTTASLPDPNYGSPAFAGYSPGGAAGYGTPPPSGAGPGTHPAGLPATGHQGPPTSHPWQAGPQPGGPGTPPPTRAHRRAGKTPWVALIAVAIVAALVASLTTGLIVGRGNGSSQAQRSLPNSTAQLGTADDNSVEVPVSSSTADSPDWQAVASAVAPSVVSIAISSSSGEGVGSGVIVDASGLVLTNDHVVGTSSEVTVTLYDGTMYKAEIVGNDPTTDLAVVRLVDAPDDLRSAVFGDSDAVKVGDPVMAMGNPLGLSNTATTGIVSALNRPVSTSTADWTSSETVVTNAIQIDAAVNPGNSGGPLFNISGEVIGITSSIATLSASDSASGSIGLGFAIPSNLADLIGSQLIENGSAQHAFLGVTLTDATASTNGQTRQGARVEQVIAGSPAEQAGLKTGDVVIAIDSQPVSGAESLTAHVRAKSSGSTAIVTLVRDGETLDAEVVLAVREDTAPAGSGSDQDGQGNNDSQPDGGSNERGSNGDSQDGWPGPNFDPWGDDENS